MNFPTYSGKQSYQSVLTPSNVAALRGKSRKGRIEGVESALICFQPSLTKLISARLGGKRVDGFSGSVTILKNNSRSLVLAVTAGFGAPAAAVALEELAAGGVRRCIAIGPAAAIRAGLRSGDVILPTEAIRDEGTSYHYLDGGEPAAVSNDMLLRFGAAVDRMGGKYLTGKVWTTDAPYRETAEEIRHFEDDGVLAVDMETSAFFCVCSALKLEAACGLVAADSVAGGVWHPPEDERKVNAALSKLAVAAVEALGS